MAMLLFPKFLIILNLIALRINLKLIKETNSQLYLNNFIGLTDFAILP